MRTILLKLAGPLQSWGTNSHFETRHTNIFPSKSGVIGMVAASLGYRRNEDEKITLLNSLDFAVRIDQPGKILRDFHTAKKYKDNNEVERTYVTNRYYLQDAVFVVALGSTDEELITKVEDALKSPYFQPFLGRRSLPVTADFFIGTNDENVIDSLKTADWQAAEWYKKQNRTELPVFADGDLIEGPVNQIERDYVFSFSQKKRHHGFRVVKKIFVEAHNPSDGYKEHDVFDALGG